MAGGSVLIAGDRDFKDMVDAMSEEFRTPPMHIPMFGMVKAMMFVARPAGASGLDLAVFENLDPRRRAGRDLADVMNEATHRGWSSFVKVTSRRKGHEEVTFVYLRPEGSHCKLLVAAIEPREATLVQVKVRPESVRRWLREPRESADRKGGLGVD
jgi:hypothetical protein